MKPGTLTFVYCDETGDLELEGVCPVHKSKECLSSWTVYEDGGPRNVFGGLEVQRFPVIEICLDIFIGVFADTYARGSGFLDDAVIHIGQIHYLSDAIASRFQIPPQDVLENKCAKVSDMREVVDRGPARVGANLPLNQRDKWLGFVGQCVVELDLGHRGSVTGFPMFQHPFARGPF